jgi:hypothetical protein
LVNSGWAHEGRPRTLCAPDRTSVGTVALQARLGRHVGEVYCAPHQHERHHARNALNVPRWAGDEKEPAWEAAEAAIAHATGNEAEAAYRRRTALARRRKLMEEWTVYCKSERR